MTLVIYAGPEVSRADVAAGFKVGDANGHCLQNRSSAEVTVLEIGSRVAADPHIMRISNMIAPAGRNPSIHTRKDGTSYPNTQRRTKET